MKKTFVFLLMLFAFSAPGQNAGEKARVDAMKSLDFLVGEWTGDGWIVRGREERATFQQRETVRYAAGSSVVVIDGLGTSTVAGNQGKVAHQAFAVVSYDAAAGKYQWRAYTPVNGEVSVEPKIGDKVLVWGFPTPAGQTRFTIALSPTGEWHEIGEFSRDGSTWAQFFEMTLKRK